MKTTPFEIGKHYREEAKVSCTEFEVSHWQRDDLGLSILFSIGFRAYAADGSERSQRSQIDIWDVTPDELRDLAASLCRAADSIAAHAAQVALVMPS